MAEESKHASFYSVELGKNSQGQSQGNGRMSSDVEDVTDDVIFKKARVGQTRVGQNLRQQSLTNFTWPKLTGKEKEESIQRDFDRMREQMDEVCARMDMDRARKQEKAKQLARERQQQHRNKIKSLKNGSAGKLQVSVLISCTHTHTNDVCSSWSCSRRRKRSTTLQKSRDQRA